MEFEWDEDKRAATMSKHGFDFDGAATIWRRLLRDPAATRIVDGETRHTAIGVVDEDETIIAVVYTMRDGRRRLISVRRGRRHEREDYKKTFGRGW